MEYTSRTRMESQHVWQNGPQKAMLRSLLLLLSATNMLPLRNPLKGKTLLE